MTNIIDTLVCSEVFSGFGLALCCNQPVDLHYGLVDWFLHGAGFLLGEIFEQILVLFISFLILLALLFNIFRNLQVTYFRTLSLRSSSTICIIYFLKLPFNVFISDILVSLTFLLCYESPAERLWLSDFAKIVNNFWPLTIFAEKLLRECSKYAFAFSLYFELISLQVFMRASTLIIRSFLSFLSRAFFPPLFYRFRISYFFCKISPKYYCNNICNIIYIFYALWISPFTDMIKY